MSHGKLTVAGLLIALVLFLLVNVLGNHALTGSRIDLTEGKLYTLSQGSKNIVAGLNEPVTLTYYFSETLAGDRPEVRTYQQRVRGLLDEFVSAGRGKVRLNVRDPEPFSEEEDEAVSAGLQGIPINTAGDAIYFGLAASGSTDEHEVVPVFVPNRERSLEYDIARIIAKLGHPDRPVVAVVTSLPMDGSPQMPFPGAPPGSPPWTVMEQLRDLFDVRLVEPAAESLPPETKLLLVVHPKHLSQPLLYSIDQFVLKGGHAMVFVDPFCEREEVPPDPQNQFAAMMADKSSNLDPLFATWGVEMTPSKFVADRQAALQVRTSQQRPETVPYVAWLGLDRDHKNLDQQDFVTSELTRLIIPSAGSLKPAQGASTEFTPLIVSSKDSEEMDVSNIQFMPDPKKLLTGFQPTGEQYTLAARIQGPARSAFPDGKPKAAPEAKPEGEEAAPAPPESTPDPDFVLDSTGPINLIVVADADMLWDEWWVNVQNFLGQKIAIPTSGNADFLVNAMDNLSGSNDLISVRSRGSFARPFERVDQLRREAEQRYREEEEALQKKLQETDQRLAELQKQKGEGSSLILSPEQRAEIERFNDEKVATRKQLRDVRHDLDKDIDSLQSRLKFLNVGAVPLLVLVAAVGLGAWRSRRKRD